MPEEVPQFGAAVPGATYVARPGGYAVLVEPAGRIAIVRDGGNWFLPGGGCDGNERADDAAVRETREECRLHIRITATIGMADELVHPALGRHIRKTCTFFLAEPISDAADERPAEHETAWVSAAEAMARLAHESQRWAVREALRMLGDRDGAGQARLVADRPDGGRASHDSRRAAELADPSAGQQVLLWVLSCFGGATLGASVAWAGAAFFHGEYTVSGILLVVGISGTLGGGLSMIAAAPLLVFVQGQRARLLITGLLAFGLTAGLLTLLLISIPPPPRS